MPEVQPPDPPLPGGISAGWLSAVKGLTLTNALVIMLLVVVLVPAYFAYRLLGDTTLLDRFLGSYEVKSSQMSPCQMIKARQRGEPYTWKVITGFAMDGGDRWNLGVITGHEPSQQETQTYCETLLAIVDWMRDSDADPPVFPGTHKEMIWPYKETREKD